METLHLRAEQSTIETLMGIINKTIVIEYLSRIKYKIEMLRHYPSYWKSEFYF